METGGSARRKSWLLLGIMVLVAAAAGFVIWWAARETILQSVDVANQPQATVPTKSTATPQLTTEVVMEGRDHIWDVDFLPGKELIFTERKGTVAIYKDGQTYEMRISDVKSGGEGGLLGLAVDPHFSQNRQIYVCFNTTKNDVKVARFRLSDDLQRLEQRQDIITNIPMVFHGQHSGCQLAWGPDQALWVGTGDAVDEDTPQGHASLGGKILRVDSDGKAVAGNLGAPFDTRVYSYGHRNTQGIAFFAKPKANALGVSAEHGPGKDDEVNLLQSGNFGWHPGAGYNQSVPMTDRSRYPNAIEALWSSGTPTTAPSGVAILKGGKWKAWDGAIAVANLKGSHLRVLILDDTAKVVKEEQVLDKQFGRLRAATLGPDADLYLSTDNGNDRIIKVTPH